MYIFGFLFGEDRDFSRNVLGMGDFVLVDLDDWGVDETRNAGAWGRRGFSVADHVF